MTTIALCGESLSENLGDGVIADGLDYALRSASEDIKVKRIDLSMRTQHASTSNRKGRMLHRSIYRHFPTYRTAASLFNWMRKRDRYQRFWLQHLENVDLLIIGGGQLLADNHMNFPLRILEATSAAKAHKVQVAFHACGVSKRWSPLAKHVFACALLSDRTISVSVRDQQSLLNLIKHLPPLEGRIEVTADPALLSQEVYGISTTPGATKIGLGIIAPEFLSRIYRKRLNHIRRQMVSLWTQLATLLDEQARQVEFFSNGNAQDHEFAYHTVEQIRLRHPSIPVRLLPRPQTPEALVKQISSFRCVVAHRLHANMVALAIGVPTVALVWDDKVRELERIPGRAGLQLDPKEATAETIMDKIKKACEQKPNSDHLIAMKKNILSSVGKLLERAKLKDA